MVRASSNLSARVAKSSIYYCEVYLSRSLECVVGINRFKLQAYFNANTMEQMGDIAVNDFRDLYPRYPDIEVSFITLIILITLLIVILITLLI